MWLCLKKDTFFLKPKTSNHFNFIPFPSIVRSTSQSRLRISQLSLSVLGWLSWEILCPVLPSQTKRWWSLSNHQSPSFARSLFSPKSGKDIIPIKVCINITHFLYSSQSLERLFQAFVPVAVQSDDCFRLPCCVTAPAGERELPPQTWSWGLHSLCSPVKTNIDFKKHSASFEFLRVCKNIYMKMSAVLTCSPLRWSISSSTLLSVSLKSLFKCCARKLTAISMTRRDWNLHNLTVLMQ